MYHSRELLHPTEVKKEWVELIQSSVKPIVEEYQLQYHAWYHDMPLWYVGDVQLGLVRTEGINILEIHKGDDNHLSLQITKLGSEVLRTVVECLITKT